MTERFDYSKLTDEQRELLRRGTRTPQMIRAVQNKKANMNWCDTIAE